MKIKAFISLIALTCGTVANAQQAAKPAILLSNYSFSANKNEIGTLATNPEMAVKTYRLSGPDAKRFSLAGNKLSIKKAFNSPTAKWYDVVITATGKAGTIADTLRIINNQVPLNRVVAHRGAWKNAPTTENSIASLKHAIKLGCQGSEFDVHMSSDSVIFIHHDPKVNGLTIENTPSSELFKIKLSNGETLPTLEQYLNEGIKQNTMRLVLEIKPSVISKERAQALTIRAVNMVRRLKAQAWVDYISFDYDVCKKVVEMDPFASVQYLNGDKAPDEVKKDKLTGLDYHFSAFEKNPDWISKALALGLTVNVWTVNDEPRMKSLLDQKVTFITTNEPEKLFEVINSRK